MGFQAEVRGVWGLRIEGWGEGGKAHSCSRNGCGSTAAGSECRQVFEGGFGWALGEQVPNPVNP